MKKQIFTALLLSQMAFSQQVPMAEVLQKFSREQVQFILPISEKVSADLTWQERKTSFSDKNIRSFVAYHDGNFVGVLSISGNEVSGNISWEGDTYSLSSENGKIIITKEENHTCGTCEVGHCSAEEHSHEEHKHSFSKIKAFNINQEQFKDTPEIYSDAIFREYRLAVLVDYSAYTTRFGSNEANVKLLLAQLETFMNEVYTRDLGVKFVLVDDPRLIRKTQDQEIFKPFERNGIEGGSFVSTHSTRRIDGIITSKNYDVGITLCETGSRYAGLADLNNAHIFGKKAAAWARYNIKTMAHEIGHLFGSQHTFSTGGILTMKTEPGNGTSLMSYGLDTVRDFFSLPSINSIRQSLLVNAPGYFADKEHTQKVGQHNPRGNAVFGIDTQNKAPRIDRSKVKKEYRLPENTYFQFDIKASDPDGNTLLYMAHQADIIETDARSKANFLTRKASPNSVVSFIPEFEIRNGNSTSQVAYSSVYHDTRGEFTFWLGVSDAGIFLQNKDAKHATQYDMVQTKVKIENGTPFRITGGIESGISGKTYKSGEKITLKWGVDRRFFDENSRVKISLSDDFGKTYKYVLVASTENDGEAEITLPNIEIGKYNHNSQMKTSAGMLKIEVIDHIAVAITENNPILGGFEIQKSNISLLNLPKDQYIKVKEIPTAPVVTATSTCPNTPTPSVSFSEKNNGNILERTWTATDSCGNTVTYTQFIEKEKEVAPLQFVNTPQDVQLACVKDVPKGEKLQLIGGTKPTQEFSQSKVSTNQYGTGFIIKRTWVATDPDAESISHSQTILVRDYVPPVLSEYPENKIVKSFSEIGFPKTLTATDNCGVIAKEILVGQGNKDNDEQGRQRYYYSWLAVDDSGNETYHEQIFTIAPNYTPTPPATPPLQWAVTSLPEVKVSCQSEIPLAQNPQTTGGKGNITITHQDTMPSNYCNATIVRTYTAKDEDGKSITLSQNIKIEDKTAPTWNTTNLPSDKIINHDEPVPSQTELTASDNCGTATVIKSERKENGKVIYTWTAKDICGNEISHQQVIQVKPKPVQPITPITWTSQLPQNVRVSCAGNVPNAENLTATGGDGTLTISHNDVRSAESCENKYVITRIYTATDGVRSIQHIQEIEVNDDIAPSFIGNLPQNITIEEGQNIPIQSILTATDNCGIANVETSERQVLENGKLKQKIYTWIAKDACGNQTHHEQIIEIKEKKVEVPNNFAKPKLYPNPTNDSFQLNIENVKGVKVYNTAGRLVKTFEPQQKYDIYNLTAEVYIIAVETENEIEHIKLIKK